MILRGSIAAVKAVVDTITTNVSTLLTRLNSNRAGWLDNLQYYTQTKSNYLDQAISTTGLKKVQVFSGTLTEHTGVAPTANHTVTAVDQTKTVVYVTWYCDYNWIRITDSNRYAYGHVGVRAKLTTPTNLELKTGLSVLLNGTTSVNYTAYVVEFN